MEGQNRHGHLQASHWVRPEATHPHKRRRCARFAEGTHRYPETEQEHRRTPRADEYGTLESCLAGPMVAVRIRLRPRPLSQDQ